MPRPGWLKHQSSLELLDLLGRKVHRHVVRPPDFPPQEMLSYTWGYLFDRVPVTLGSDGHHAMVTGSCHEPLRNLRKETSNRLL